MDQQDEHWRSLDARLDQIAEEFAHLKGRYDAKEIGETGFVARARGYIPIAALLISLMTAGFTAYDRFVTGPAQQIAMERAAVRATLDELSSLSLTIQKAMQDDPASAQTTMGALAPTRYALVKRAASHFEHYPDEFLVTDHFLMGNELLSLGRHQEALIFAEAAMGHAVDPLEQANAKILLARVLGISSPLRDVGKARRLLQAAYDQAKVTVSPISGGVLTTVLIDRLVLELNERDCDQAQEVVDEVALQLNRFNAPPNTRTTMTETFSSIEQNQYVGCALDYAKLEL